MNKKFISVMLGLSIATGSFTTFAADAVSGASSTTTSTTKPSTSTAKPSTSTAKPSTSTTKPSTNTTKPSTSTAKPSTSTAKPSATTSSVNKPGEVYVVKAGDVLSRIAVKYGMTYQEIATYNNIKNPHLIYVGQKIVIPVKTTQTTPKPAETKPTTTVEKPVEVKPEVVTPAPEVDVVTSASVANDMIQLEKALSTEGTWIICAKGDLTIDKEIIVEGEFRNKNNPEDKIARKLALYDQDENKNVTASHTLTAPKMIVKSENFKIQEGTFVGDIYVDAPGFTLVNTQVEGNIYFTKEAYRKSFVLQKEAKVTGSIITGTEVDSVSGASLATDEASLEKALGNKWIITLKEDITTDKEIVMSGRFEKQDKKDATKVVAGRKLALYDQDENKKVTASYTLQAPKLTVKSTNAKIQEGTFVGDIYVEAPGFSLVRTTVEGNVYFAKEAYMRTADLSQGTVKGEVAVKTEGIDAVTGASFATEESKLHMALSQEGTWIICATDDFTTDKEIVVEGEFRNKNKPENDIYRKLALYNQDSGKNVIETYVLTSPKMIVKSENFKIQEGTFVGDIYVEAPGFTLTNVTVEGNIYFAKEAYKETFKLEQDAKVIGSLLEAK